MNRVLSSICSVALLAGLIGTAGGGIASAKPCHDAHGKFVKCSAAAMAMPAKKM